MNNKTVHKYVIKMRGDNVYDLYIDDVWIASRGHYESILEDLRVAIQQIDSGVIDNNA
jgi:hypothetical protein